MNYAQDFICKRIEERQNTKFPNQSIPNCKAVTLSSIQSYKCVSIYIFIYVNFSDEQCGKKASPNGIFVIISNKSK